MKKIPHQLQMDYKDSLQYPEGSTLDLIKIAGMSISSDLTVMCETLQLMDRQDLCEETIQKTIEQLTYDKQGLVDSFMRGNPKQKEDINNKEISITYLDTLKEIHTELFE